MCVCVCVTIVSGSFGVFYVISFVDWQHGFFVQGKEPDSVPFNGLHWSKEPTDDSVARRVVIVTVAVISALQVAMTT